MVAQKKTPSNQNPKSPLSISPEEYRYGTSPDWQTSSEDSTTFPSPEDMALEDEEELFLTKLSKGETLKQTPTSLMLCKDLYLHSWEDDPAKRTFSFVMGVKFFAAYYADCLAQTERQLKEPSKTEAKRYLDVLDKQATDLLRELAEEKSVIIDETHTARSKVSARPKSTVEEYLLQHINIDFDKRLRPVWNKEVKEEGKRLISGFSVKTSPTQFMYDLIKYFKSS